MNYNYYSYYPNVALRSSDNRNVLLPLLFGAAVGFPFGYIASNTNKNNNGYYPQPMPYYPYQPYPYGYMPQGPFMY